MSGDEIALSAFARNLINHKVRRLIRRGFFSDTEEDLRQELLVRLLHGLKHFDPSRGRADAFVATVVDHAGGALLRERLAAKRNVTPRSIDREPARDPIDPLTVATPRLDRELDLAEGLDALMPELRALAELIMSSRGISEAARRHGVPRSSFLRQLEKLRRHMEKRGLRIYAE